MIDLVLFMGRIALVVVLYLFLFVVMKTGIGLVRGQRKDPAIWCVDVDKGPRQLRGLHVDMLGPVVIGRSPSSDIVIAEPIVSSTHARPAGTRARARRPSLHEWHACKRPPHPRSRHPA